MNKFVNFVCDIAQYKPFFVCEYEKCNLHSAYESEQEFEKILLAEIKELQKNAERLELVEKRELKAVALKVIFEALQVIAVINKNEVGK